MPSTQVSTLTSELSNIGNSAASIAKWADARKSSTVDLGGGVTGKVISPKSYGDEDRIVLDEGAGIPRLLLDIDADRLQAGVHQAVVDQPGAAEEVEDRDHRSMPLEE